MQWLDNIVDEIVARKPEGEILISSGGSPSGTHHLGHLRELVTCDVILRALRARDRDARHIYFVDDLDALRKIPVNIPPDYEKYLGQSLCDIPAPEGSGGSYADYFLNGLIESTKTLGIEVEFIRSHKKYREGFFESAIEESLSNIPAIRNLLENISGHKLDDGWSPIQINEDGYLKKRRFIEIDKNSKTVIYQDVAGNNKTINYQKGDVKLDWRIDWPARWWLLGVDVEPFGRDHSTKGGSYDTGAEIIRQIFDSEPPYPVGYDFINMAGDTKKMSASKGTGLDAESVVNVLPPEIVRYFIISAAPNKRLYFNPIEGVSRLIDEFSLLLEKEPDSSVLYYSRIGVDPVISRIPFSLLVESYQAALKNPEETIKIISRTEYGKYVDSNIEIIKEELKYISQWLEKWAPDDSKFELRENINQEEFSEQEKAYFGDLAQKISEAPENADGEWFHKAIYYFKESGKYETNVLFKPLYRLLIGKESGPRAGWFLSMLPRDWLIKRLKLES